jgi:hypothetical protein
MCFSQLASPQPALTQDATQDTSRDSSQLLAARPRHYLLGIVPDMRSSIGEDNVILTTQYTMDIRTDTNQTQVKEDVVKQSVLLFFSRCVIYNPTN